MKSILRLLALAALVPLLGLTARAQVTYSTDGMAGFHGGGAQINDYSFGQSFTGVSEISAVSWLMYNNGGTASTEALFTMYVMDWTNPSGVSLYASHTTLLTNIANGATGTLDFTSLGYTLDPASTYALFLSISDGDPGSSPFVHQYVDSSANDGSFFSSGTLVRADGTSRSYNDEVAFESSISDSGGAGIFNNANEEIGLTIVATMGPAPAPVPEPKAAAAGLAALFVAGLISRQVWLRRKAAAPAPIAA